MKELAEVLGSLFRKISDIFDVFDLSFIISGAASLGALWFGFFKDQDQALVQLQSMAGSPSGFMALVVASYVSGLVCFAAGRAIRTTCRYVAAKVGSVFRRSGPAGRAGDERGGRHEPWSSPVERLMGEALQAHGLLDEERVKPYHAPGGLARLYVRLWAKLRETPTLAASFTLVKRYWVMAATYDGLGFAGVLWVVVLLKREQPFSVGDYNQSLVLGMLVLVICACFFESTRLGRYQVEELVATLALVDRRTRLSWVSPEVMRLAPVDGEPPVTVPRPASGAALPPEQAGINTAKEAASDPLRPPPTS